MTLTALSGVASRQVFLAGSIHDALSGRAPWTQPSILLRFQAAPQRPLALRLRHHLPTGLYAFYGDPRSALPVLAAPDTLDLELVVSAPRYATATVPISLTEADLQLVEPTREVEGQTVALARRPALPLLLDVLLAPLPLVLVGRVVRADDPSVAVVGASTCRDRAVSRRPGRQQPSGRLHAARSARRRGNYAAGHRRRLFHPDPDAAAGLPPACK